MPFQQPPAICPVCKKEETFKFIRNFLKNNAKYSLYQCLTCQAQFWLPFKSVIREWREDVSPNKVRRLAHSEMQRGYHRIFLERNRSFPESTKVLDLGCGIGELIFKLKKRGCEVWGVDFDAGAIKIAREEFSLEHVFSMSFDDFFNGERTVKFDIITFFEVLEHIENPFDFINKVKNLLKPYGKIVFSTPSRQRVFVNANKWDFPPNHLTRWDEESLKNLFCSNGFKIDYLDYVDKFRLILGAIDGRLRSGLVQKSLSSASGKKRMIIPKILYLLGKLKQWILGGVPALALWVFGKLTKRNNGIIYMELTHEK